MSNKHFIHLEGMDLAGKSTIAKIIAQRSCLDWNIYCKCLSKSNPILNLANDLGGKNIYDDKIYGYLFYVAVMADLNGFNLEENTIQDSFLLLRSIVFHRNNNNYDLVKLFEGLVEEHPVPEFSFYLTASIEERQRRFNNRLNNNPKKVTRSDSLIFKDPITFAKMDCELMELSKKYFNSIVIDTSKMTREEIAEYIIGFCGV